MADRVGDRSKTPAVPILAARDGILRVELFGGCTISLGGREIVLANRKGKGILGYLAFAPGHRETRERLAGHFWGDLTEDKARGNLRQTLKSVRDTFEAAGFKGFDTLYADPGFLPGTVEFDVVEAFNSIAEEWPVDALLDQPRLADTLLEGFEDLGSTFRNWLLVKRECLSQKFARDLQDHMSTQTGTTAAAARLARALLQTDPTHEPAARVIMRWQADAGDMAGAMTVYNRLWEELDTVHGQPPDPETEALIVAIKGGSYRPPKLQVAAAAPSLGLASTQQQPMARPAAPQEKLVLIIGKFGHLGERTELTYAFRHELSTRLAKFREWLLVDGEPATLPVSDNAPCYTLSAPLLEGGGAVRLMLSLKDSRTSAIVWGETFNIELENFSSSLQAVMRQIATKLHIYISVERLNRITAAPEVSLDLHDRWILAQSLVMGWRPMDRPRLKDLLNEIVRDAPNFSRAYSAVAQHYNTEHIVLPGLLRTVQGQQESLRCSMQAVSLDPLDSRAHLHLAWSQAFVGHHDAAVLSFDNACNLNDSDSWSITSAALGYAFSDDVRRARAAAIRSRDVVLFPNALHWCYQSNISFVLGDYEDCISAAEKSGDVVTNLPGWHAAALALIGRTEDARRRVAHLRTLIVAMWQGSTSPSDAAIARWFLQCFPIKNPAVLNRLKIGLAAAGLSGE